MKKFNSTSAYKEGGFTLIEILISIFLLAIMTLGVMNVTQDSMNTMDRTNEFNNNNLRIETAFSRFEWDLIQVYSPLYFSSVMNVNQNLGVTTNTQQPPPQDNPDETPPGQQPPATQVNPALQAFYQQMLSRFERNERFITLSKEGLPIPRLYAPEKNVLEFFTSSNRRKMENTPQSHFAWVRYGLMDQDVGNDDKVHPEMPTTVKNFTRWFTPTDPYRPERIQIDDIKGAVLLRNVESLEFQYWDYKRKRWETNLRVIEDGERLLRGVKVLITWWDSEGKKVTERTFRPHWPMVAPVDTPATPNRQNNQTNTNQQGNRTETTENDQDEEE